MADSLRFDICLAFEVGRKIPRKFAQFGVEQIRSTDAREESVSMAAAYSRSFFRLPGACLTTVNL